MKKKILFIAVFIASVALWSCEPKWPQNGKLDGTWQITEIIYEQGDTTNTVYPERTYYCIQLNLVALKRIGHMEGVNYEGIMGYFGYTGDSLHLDMRNTSLDELAPFGLSGTKESFKVDQLTNNRMTLSAPGRLIYFRKY